MDYHGTVLCSCNKKRLPLQTFGTINSASQSRKFRYAHAVAEFGAVVFDQDHLLGFLVFYDETVCSALLELPNSSTKRPEFAFCVSKDDLLRHAERFIELRLFVQHFLLT